MKNIEHLATFDRYRDGSGQFGGIISLTAIKKLKSPEIRVVLIPFNDLPPAIAGLMDNQANPDSIIMLGVGANSNASFPRHKK